MPPSTHTAPVATTVADRILTMLKHDIVSARLYPGMPLDDKALSAKYQVSRTPVRDALLQLSALGYVRIVPRMGIFVVELGADELADMFETLAHLEGLCTELAARRIDAAGRSALASAHRAGRPSLARKQTGGYDQANDAFHDVLYRSAGNDYLAQQIRELRNRTHPYRMRHFDDMERMACSWREHATIMEAVLDGDGVSARQAATRHVVQGRADFSGFLARFPDGLYAARAVADDAGDTQRAAFDIPLHWMRAAWPDAPVSAHPRR